MIAKFKLPPFIATLGTQMVTLGLGSIITNVQTQRFPTVGTSDELVQAGRSIAQICSA